MLSGSVENLLKDDDDKQDNDSGIQNDDKDEDEEKTIKKKNKPTFKIKSPKKSSSRSKSPVKNLQSPEKSPKKRKKKIPPKVEKKDHDGTIVPNAQFDADRSAQRLLQALQGISTDSKLLIEIVVTHSFKQRSKIKAAYDPLSRKDLLRDMKDQLGGMFCEVMIGLVSPHSRFDAQCVRDIVEKYEENLGFEKSFISILGNKSKKEIEEIRRFYKMEFKVDMNEDIARCVSTVEGYQTILPALLSMERDHSLTGIDIQAAKLTAQKLAENGIKGENPVSKEELDHEDTNDTDDDKEGKNAEFNEDKNDKDEGIEKTKPSLTISSHSLSDLEELLFCRSPNQIKETLKEYEGVNNTLLTDTLRMEFSELKAEAYCSLVEILIEPQMYFAQELDEAIQGSDWDEDTIIRVFVSRSEIDLKIIAEKFQDLSGRNLEKSIQMDSGGDFQSILLKILKPDLKLN